MYHHTFGRYEDQSRCDLDPGAEGPTANRHTRRQATIASLNMHKVIAAAWRSYEACVAPLLTGSEMSRPLSVMQRRHFDKLELPQIRQQCHGLFRFQRGA